MGAAYGLGEGVGHDPDDGLVADLRLVVDPLDRDEDLPQLARLHDVVLELTREPRALGHALLLEELGGREVGEEVDHAERVVHVAHGVHERRESLLDDVVHRVARLLVPQRRGGRVLVLPQRLRGRSGDAAGRQQPRRREAAEGRGGAPS